MTSDQPTPPTESTAAAGQRSSPSAGSAKRHQWMEDGTTSHKYNQRKVFRCVKCGVTGTKTVLRRFTNLHPEGCREDLLPNVKPPCELAAAAGYAVRWVTPAEELPPTYQSVLVYGVLEGETKPDTHEGYRMSKAWCSVRTEESHFQGGQHPTIAYVTHWAWMPKPHIEKGER